MCEAYLFVTISIFSVMAISDFAVSDWWSTFSPLFNERKANCFFSTLKKWLMTTSILADILKVILGFFDDAIASRFCLVSLLTVCRYFDIYFNNMYFFLADIGKSYPHPTVTLHPVAQKKDLNSACPMSLAMTRTCVYVHADGLTGHHPDDKVTTPKLRFLIVTCR